MAKNGGVEGGGLGKKWNGEMEEEDDASDDIARSTEMSNDIVAHEGLFCSMDI